MSDTAQEPSMEEILASIRRIISEDGQEEEEGEPAEAAEPEPESEPEPEPEPEEEEEDVLELTDEVEEEDEPEEAYEPEPVAPLFEEQRRPVEPEPAAAPAPRQEPVHAGLVSPPQADETVSSFAHLAHALHGDQHETPIGAGYKTLEEMTKEVMRPMLKAWLDEHLPDIVERLVQEEIERMASRAQRR